ncbi:MAG: hypothetical protein WKF91_22490, partial [Segetibacter sp.]
VVLKHGGNNVSILKASKKRLHLHSFVFSVPQSIHFKFDGVVDSQRCIFIIGTGCFQPEYILSIQAKISE